MAEEAGGQAKAKAEGRDRGRCRGMRRLVFLVEQRGGREDDDDDFRLGFKAETLALAPQKQKVELIMRAFLLYSPVLQQGQVARMTKRGLNRIKGRGAAATKMQLMLAFLPHPKRGNDNASLSWLATDM